MTPAGTAGTAGATAVTGIITVVPEKPYGAAAVPGATMTPVPVTVPWIGAVSVVPAGRVTMMASPDPSGLVATKVVV